jgi:hypothetical protein
MLHAFKSWTWGWKISPNAAAEPSALSEPSIVFAERETATLGTIPKISRAEGVRLPQRFG